MAFPLLEFNSFVPHLTRHDYSFVLPRLQPFPGQELSENVTTDSSESGPEASAQLSTLQLPAAKGPLPLPTENRCFEMMDGRFFTHLACYPQGDSSALHSLISLTWLRIIELCIIEEL